MIVSMSLISQFAVLVVALALQGAEAKPPNRIIGGIFSEDGDIPYQVSLKRNKVHFCGGTIIGKRHILTAAHCIEGVSTYPYDDMTIVTGTSFSQDGVGKINHIKSVTVHPEFLNRREDSWKNDIAIIALDKDIKFNKNTKIAKLPSKDTEPKLKCIASGWGDMYYPLDIRPINLRRLVTTTIENKECGELHPKMQIYESHVCAFASKSAGLCSGDSGGPLLNDGVVHGVASWVTPCAKGTPDVFTRVYYFRDFIKKTMEST